MEFNLPDGEVYRAGMPWGRNEMPWDVIIANCWAAAIKPAAGYVLSIPIGSDVGGITETEIYNKN